MFFIQEYLFKNKIHKVRQQSGVNFMQIYLLTFHNLFEMQSTPIHQIQQGMTTCRSQSMRRQFQPHRTSKSTSEPSLSHRYISCKFHPNENLHTFCISPQCMLPMCSTCISIHNMDHLQSKTYGNYKNLVQLINTTVSTIQQQQSIIQQLSHEYVADFQKKKMIQQKCKDMLNKSRIKVHEEIDRIYDRYLIDIEEKINYYNQQLEDLYGVVEEALHKMYSQLNLNKEGLSVLNYDNSVFHQQNTKRGSGKSMQMYTFTPENTNMMYRHGQYNQKVSTKKQDRKLMKILIEYCSSNLTQVNYNKISKIKKQISELKHFDFVINVNWQKISKFLSNLCQQIIEVKSSMKEQIKSKNYSQINMAGNPPIRSQSSIDGGNKEEIGEIMKNTNYRMSKMQLNSNTVVKESPSNIEYFGSRQRKQNFKPERV